MAVSTATNRVEARFKLEHRYVMAYIENWGGLTFELIMTEGSI